MNVRVVVQRAVLETRYSGGVAQYEADAPHAQVDGDRIAVEFASTAEAEDWVSRLGEQGIDGGSVRVEPAPFQRFETLSTSESGLTYVRERKLGVTRVLTASELEDFNDPPPCPDCGEQFGCDHFNCAGEPLLREEEIETSVPKEWVPFARDYGISRADLERLRLIEMDKEEGEYRLASGVSSDMRLQELVLLLNEAR